MTLKDFMWLQFEGWVVSLPVQIAFMVLFWWLIRRRYRKAK